ncbi:LolA-like outer membrane lipoprotein chaperone [Nitrosophilus kaiyonis]|uniref:LolA-like outer membrane lipoprotein chaperone n=1 Tax=Nitrosophilus kaiyonis TaxID=2930200 RepID=UPI002492FB16|nr:LolA-like outer membrane lipoprotein chaperone [Nitrosophilus kaiyonis]
MKTLVLFIISQIILFAQIDIDSFKSSFLQTVKSNNKIVKYKGELYFKKPAKILWKYKEPIIKSIYIINDQVVIIEPEIEQVTISHFSETKNIIDILKNAKKVKENLYIAIYKDQNFKIFLDNNQNLKKIIFKDELDNNIEIVFLNPKKNIDIEDKIFEYKINPEYDVIFQ